MSDSTRPRALLCRCAGAGIIQETVWRQTLEGLTAVGLDVLAADDLCGMAARLDPVLMDFLASSPRVVAACHSRAVQGLLRFAGQDPISQDLAILDMRSASVPGVSPVLPSGEHPVEGRGSVTFQGEPANWIPWYPVIDIERCRNCRQCASFCLFSVYETGEDGRVRVCRPQNCKTNCPACSRICPEYAIMFPKFGESPYNGDIIDPERLAVKPARVDLSDLQREDVLGALMERRKAMRQRILDGARPGGETPSPGPDTSGEVEPPASQEES